MPPRKHTNQQKIQMYGDKRTNWFYPKNAELGGRGQESVIWLNMDNKI